jgi:hypothetical protein
MKTTPKISLVLVLLLFILSACAETVPTEVDVDAMMTAGIGTMVMAYFETQTAVAPTVTVEHEPTQRIQSLAVPESQTPAPTLTSQLVLVYFTPTLGTLTPGMPTPTGTKATPTVDPATLAYGCNNLDFVRDVTIPAGTVVKPGESFTKTWKVADNGTCKWIFYYQLLHLGGEKFSYSTVKLQKGVEVGKWHEISINLQAPRSTGTYSGYWRLSDGEGHMFGKTLGVSIVVGMPTNTPPPPSSTPTNTLQPSPTSTNTTTATPTSTSTPTETASPTVVSP